MPVNLVGLTDAEVREYMAQMAHVIQMQAQAMTAQVNWQDDQRRTHLFATWLTNYEISRG